MPLHIANDATLSLVDLHQACSLVYRPWKLDPDPPTDFRIGLYIDAQPVEIT